MVTVSDVRAVINVPDRNELSDDAVASAIARAEAYISELVAVYGVRPSTSMQNHAILSYAAYLAYLAYSDHVIHTLPGSFDQEGVWNPVAAVVLRDVKDKLDRLGKAANDAIDLILRTAPNTPPGTLPELVDSAKYPDTFRLSNLPDAYKEELV